MEGLKKKRKKRAPLIKGIQINIFEENTSPVSLDWKHLAFKTEGTLSLNNLFKTDSLQMSIKKDKNCDETEAPGRRKGADSPPARSRCGGFTLRGHGDVTPLATHSNV